jgi:hypothetical protein
MAVVINDFEVVAEEPPPAAETNAAEGSPAPAAPPMPQEVELINRRLHERAQRVRAD